MKVIQITETRFSELFENLAQMLRLEQYQNKHCKCEVIGGERPVESMHRHMHYHIHKFKRELEDS